MKKKMEQNVRVALVRLFLPIYAFTLLMVYDLNIAYFPSLRLFMPLSKGGPGLFGVWEFNKERI